MAGGGTPDGAEQAARSLIEQGVDALVSFGLAGGLDPSLPAGALLVPQTIVSDGETFATDSATADLFGGATAHVMFAGPSIVAAAAEKQVLFQETGAHAIDLESGRVAQVAAEFGRPFAVVRAVCDPASRSLPPAAAVALDAAGGIVPWRIVRSLAQRPQQIGGLLALARDAAAARATLTRVIAAFTAIRA